ncbi:class II aldolase/adducin family protein [Azospirillum sp. B21]|uniref:class II aldolase/adducin family protein n=1 Tax=Azospirillum sp. B21 TaxID=2607496 RepID=UPI0011EBB286|nr:class II aldolase/adducin family protein [Azospirillum sp. B21]KAA0572663.1 class II aldolase/adducin family protein [Azospirillum sp. B21]
MTHIQPRPRKFWPPVDPVSYTSVEEERQHRKQRLAATFRLFGRYGFDQGLAGHVTARDPEHPDRFWINPLGQHFRTIRVSDLHLVDGDGTILQGDRAINQAGFTIHSAIHRARPDVVAAAHAHSTYGKAWSALGRPLAPLSQDSAAFYEDQAIFDPYSGVVLTEGEGKRLVEALGDRKLAILKNHGLLTVGPTVEAAAWWFISADNAAHTQLLAEAAGRPQPIDHETALLTRTQVGTHQGSAYNFHPLWEWIVATEPDLLD